MMSRTSCAAAAGLFLAFSILSVGAAALAQTPGRLKDKPTITIEQRAKTLFLRAEGHYRQREFKKAVAAYKAALELHHHPNILFNIAQCYRQLKELDKALFFYKLFLADWARLQPGTRPSNHAEIVEHIKRLEAAIKAREAKRRQDEREGKRLAAARLALERAKLAIGAKAKKGPALLRIDGLDAVLARVFVDGKHKATAPITAPIAVEPGIIEVQIRARGYRRWEKQVQIGPGGKVVLRVELDRLEPSRFWLASTITAAALAAGAETLAIVFTTRAKDHYEGTPPFDSDRNVAIGGHIAAGLLAAYAVTSLLLYLRSGRTDDRLTAAVATTRGGTVAAAAWRF